MKHYHKGRFLVTPALLGRPSDGCCNCCKTWKLESLNFVCFIGFRPVRDSFSCTHLSVLLGGSLTTRKPFNFNNLHAHSAVIAGGPNDRAVTKSAPNENFLFRAVFSASSQTIVTLSEALRSLIASNKKSALFSFRSISTNSHSLSFSIKTKAVSYTHLRAHETR